MQVLQNELLKLQIKPVSLGKRLITIQNTSSNMETKLIKLQINKASMGIIPSELQTNSACPACN